MWLAQDQLVQLMLERHRELRLAARQAHLAALAAQAQASEHRSTLAAVRHALQQAALLLSGWRVRQPDPGCDAA